MSRKTTAALIAALGINFTLAGGALMLANLNKPATYDADLELANSYGETDTVAGVKADAQAGHLLVPLKAAQQGGNTRVTFTCGKGTPAGREVHEGTWDSIAGAVLYDAERRSLLAVEAVFDTRSLRTDAHGLTATVTTKEKWFDIDNHPMATFLCAQIDPVDAATPSYTHDLIGQFTLNGITKSLTVPAKLGFTGQSLTIDASFVILRSDFDVAKRESSLAGAVGGVVSTVEDEVQMSVRVTAAPDLSSTLAELATLVESQQERLRVAEAERSRLQMLVRKVELLEQKTSDLAAGAITRPQAVDASRLPKMFKDTSPGDGGDFPFEMALVPGDEAEGIAPFYMSTHEVTWGMIDRWMYLGDLEETHSVNERSDLIYKDGVRPTPLFGEPLQLVQFKQKDNPAMAMSLKTAQLYAQWLSEKTGRRYRLPTIEEWKHAVRAGGGRPANLSDFAWHEDNAKTDDLGINPASAPVGQKKPNDLGIYDLFGNVAEWVTGTGEDRVIVGGSFLTPAEDITLDWQMVEDQSIWNLNYPNDPKSLYWYSDVYYTGIRLVCEPASVVANPPADQ